MNKTEPKKMSKAKGYAILLFLLVGVVLIWAATSSVLLLGLGAIALYAAFWIYQMHVKSGGITLEQAWSTRKK